MTTSYQPILVLAVAAVAAVVVFRKLVASVRRKFPLLWTSVEVVTRGENKTPLEVALFAELRGLGASPVRRIQWFPAYSVEVTAASFKKEFRPSDFGGCYFTGRVLCTASYALWADGTRIVRGMVTEQAGMRPGSAIPETADPVTFFGANHHVWERLAGLVCECITPSIAEGKNMAAA